MTGLPIDLATLAAFIPAALALNLTPGADMMFCIGQGLKGGPRTAMAANFGIALGVFVHAAIAGLGLSAVIAAAPWAFDAIRCLGVGYLLWLAWGALRTRPPGAPGVRVAVRPFRVFGQALAVNLTNPKVILFVLAFLPQFTDPARGALLPQFLALGAILGAGGLVVNGVAGVFAGGLGRRFAGSGTANRWLGRLSAGIFAGLALRLALMEKS